MEIQLLHHMSLPVKDLEKSKRFYREIQCLREIQRPNFPFGGAWFQIGERQELHLIHEHTDATYRANKTTDPGDIHFAVRVRSFRAMLEFLQSKGYREDAGANDLMHINVVLHAPTGYPQLYILDPDRHLIEINAEKLD
ncbi:MAG: glyoxalase [Terriglobia bacterium]|nr:MAG: glyoxalase [Terriglobia bacterium]